MRGHLANCTQKSKEMKRCYWQPVIFFVVVDVVLGPHDLFHFLCLYQPLTSRSQWLITLVYAPLCSSVQPINNQLLRYKFAMVNVLTNLSKDLLASPLLSRCQFELEIEVCFSAREAFPDLDWLGLDTLTVLADNSHV
jgi:hypothetical protein